MRNIFRINDLITEVLSNAIIEREYLDYYVDFFLIEIRSIKKNVYKRMR